MSNPDTLKSRLPNLESLARRGRKLGALTLVCLTAGAGVTAAAQAKSHESARPVAKVTPVKGPETPQPANIPELNPVSIARSERRLTRRLREGAEDGTTTVPVVARDIYWKDPEASDATTPFRFTRFTSDMVLTAHVDGNLEPFRPYCKDNKPAATIITVDENFYSMPNGLNMPTPQDHRWPASREMQTKVANVQFSPESCRATATVVDARGRIAYNALVGHTQRIQMNAPPVFKPAFAFPQ